MEKESFDPHAENRNDDGKIQFYYDRKLPEVERLARAICEKRGINPDELVTDNGYDETAFVPAWYKWQDSALDYLACKSVDSN